MSIPAPLSSRAILLACSLGCAGPGFDYADLPERPILLVYRTREESERVAEIRQRAKQPPRRVRRGEHHIRLEDVGSVLGIGPSQEDRMADLLGRLAFMDPRTREVTIADFETRGARPLDWSPDGRRLLFLSFRRTVPHIFEYLLETGEIVAVTHGDEDDLDACYGPDGRIAFARITPLRQDGPGGARIFVLEPGGGQPRPITPGPSDRRPAWSPDGKLLVYETRDASGREAIAAVDPFGGGEPHLLARGRAPVFTPDGRWIVYSAHTREGWKLWKMHADGGGKRPIGRSPHDENEPSVSPDGRFAVFVSTQEDRQRLVVRSMEGLGDRPLLTEGDGLGPTW